MHASKIYSHFYIWPAFLLFFILFLFPNLIGFYYALTDWNAMSDNVRFVGLRNFIDLFDDSANLVFLKNTFLFAIFTSLFKGVIGLALALLLNEGIRSRNMLRTIFFLPVILSNLIVGILFQQIYYPDGGLLNSLLDGMGLHMLTRAWIADPQLAIWSSMGVDIWKGAGFNMVIFLAGLQTVPKEMREAADIDGATRWHSFWNVIFPFIMPSIVINMLLNMIAGFKVFDIIFALTNGGPGRASEVINLTLFSEFGRGNYGYSTALGVLLFLFLAILSIGMVRLLAPRSEGGA